jgi:hypothetical protein
MSLSKIIILSMHQITAFRNPENTTEHIRPYFKASTELELNRHALAYMFNILWWPSNISVNFIDFVGKI